MRYFVYKDDEFFGPMRVEEMRTLFEAGTFAQGMPACVEGSEAWTSVGEVLGLAQTFYVYTDDYHGPLSAEQLQDCVDAGTFLPEHAACAVGSEVWQSVADCLSQASTQGQSPYRVKPPQERPREVKAIEIPSVWDDDASEIGVPWWKKLLCALVALLLCAASIAGTWFYMKPDTAYQKIEPLADIVETLNTDPRALRELGHTIRPSADYRADFYQGAFDINTALMVKGSRGEGKLFVDTTLKDGQWRYGKMLLDTQVGDSVMRFTTDLLVPSADERTSIIMQTLQSFAHAVRHDDFEAFHKTLHPAFQQEHTAQELSTIFKAFSEFDFASLQGLLPQITDVKKDEKDNQFQFIGFFQQQSIRFHFTITVAGYPERKLRGILFEVKTREDPTAL